MSKKLSKKMVLEEDSRINDSDITRMTYEVQDMSKEIELLTGVGFESVVESYQYHLFSRGNLYALLIDDRVIQGPLSHVFDRFATLKNYASAYPELYKSMLETVSLEGVV